MMYLKLLVHLSFCKKNLLNYSISHLYKHPHLENQPLFDIKDQKSLDFYQYINNNGA